MNPSTLVRIPTVGLLIALCAGCTVEDNARRIIEYNTEGGEVAQRILGTGEHLVQTKKIDLHRRYKAPDGVEIDVWVPKAYRGADTPARGSVVILHGLYEHKADFPYDGVAKRLARKGFNVVRPDLRAHGRSGGKYVTYGAKEKHDIKAVVDGLLSEGDIHEPIYVFGNELGAATAIQYAVIDPRCKGVMAMTAYKDARSLARRWLSALLSDEDFEAALERAGQIAGFDPDETSSVKAASKLTDTPLLLVHGILDLTVPTEHAEAIFRAASGPKKLIPKPILDWTIMEDWIADRMEELATKGLPSEGQ